MPQILLLLSAVIAGFVGIISVFSFSSIFHVPFVPSNTIGTLNALVVYLIAISLFACITIATTRFEKKGRTKQILTLGLSVMVWVLTLILLLVLDYALLWVLLLAGCAVLFVCVLFRPSACFSLGALVVPSVFVVIALAFLTFFASPFRVQLPLEVSPSTRASLEIARAVLHGREAYFGTGPGSYAMNFAKYHPKSLNETDFWNTRFDRASSFVLTLVPTVGLLGSGLFVLFLSAILLSSVSGFVKQKNNDEWILSFRFFVPWFSLAVAAFLFPFNESLVIALVLFSGLLAASLLQKETHMKLACNTRGFVFSIVCFVVLFFGLCIGIFLTADRYIAEIAYTRAIRADRAKTDTKTIVINLDRAVTLNRWNDDYVRNLSSALLFRVQDELKAVSKDTTPLSDASKKYLQALVAASVNASVRATDLSPYAVSNWLVRGEVYRALAGLVDKSETFSLDAFTHAIDLEPLNPNHWNELGKTELAISDEMQPLTLSSDVAASAKAKTDRQHTLDRARNDFTKAIELKSNFAPAHYQLALLYEREGKLDDAIGKLEAVQTYNNTDVGVGFELGNLYIKRGAEGDLILAKNIFERVTTFAPSYSDAHWFLGSVYEKLNDRERALKEIEIVAKLNPNNQIVKTRLLNLKQISP